MYKLTGLLALLLLLSVQLTAAASPDESAFRRVWERSDAQVANGNLKRLWYWGPAPLHTLDEPYIEGFQGKRRVQYWDKGRMEISNPSDNAADAWYVTSGLLSLEMIGGRVQIGDNKFEKRSRANIPIAGDPDAETNAEAPTYGDFYLVTTIFLDSRLQPISASPIGPGNADSAAPPRFGDLVDETLDGEGTVGSRPDLAAAFPGTRLVHYDGVLSHNIPKIFWDTLQQIGKVEVNGEQRQDLPLDWLYVVGHPASEPYWVHTKFNGNAQDVLVQVYERRILTYNPHNTVGWQIEMGNLGQHYYRWRYEETQSPPSPTLQRPDNISATVEPAEGPRGTKFAITLAGFRSGEKVSVWLTYPDQSVLASPVPGVAKANGEVALDGHSPFTIVTDSSDPVGVWAITGQGEKSGHTSVAYFTVLEN